MVSFSFPWSADIVKSLEKQKNALQVV